MQVRCVTVTGLPPMRLSSRKESANGKEATHRRSTRGDSRSRICPAQLTVLALAGLAPIFTGQLEKDRVQSINNLMPLRQHA